MLRGEIAIVDDEDYDLVASRRWRLVNGYVTRSDRQQSGYEAMHRLIVGLATGSGKAVDHINGNKLDNRRANLRICTIAENTRNSAKSRNNKSGFKGVCTAPRGKWRAQIYRDKKAFYLGTFRTPEEAHAAYCEAAKKLHGEFANFGKHAYQIEERRP